MGLSVTIDRELIKFRADLVGATTEHVSEATVSALREMKKRVRTIIKKQVAEDVNIPQKAISKRFYFSQVNKGDSELEVWIGAWHVSLYSIGKDPEGYGLPGIDGGVKAGQRPVRYFLGAFMAKIYGKREGAWIRTSSKHYSPDMYGSGGGGGLSGSLRGRFPVKKPTISIEDAIEQALEGRHEEFAEIFDKLFIANLNYHMNVKGGKK